MRNRSPIRLPIRRLIALAAAYVVALQVALLPLSVAASSPFGTPLCSASADSKTAPGKADTGCACASGCGAQCCAPAHLNPPTAAVAVAPRLVRVLTPARAFKAAALATLRGPQIPRAPPLA